MAVEAAAHKRAWREPGLIPGFGLTLGATIVYLSLFLLIPLAALVVRPLELGVTGIWMTLNDARVAAALKLSFGVALAAAAVNTVTGLIVAWTLVRYRFPGRGLLDALVDVPFAMPTAVAGIALATLYAPNGWIGGLLAPLGVKVAYTPLGIFVALVAVGLPFVVRSVQPVLQDLDAELEEAAFTLGASAFQTQLSVILPAIAPALLSGFALAFARAVGEYGSVIFIAGNLPMVSEIAPLLITIKLEQFNYAGAAVLGLAMLVLSFGGLLVVNLLQLALRPGGRP